MSWETLAGLALVMAGFTLGFSAGTWLTMHHWKQTDKFREEARSIMERYRLKIEVQQKGSKS
jgi:hypothetical protein